MEEHLEVLDRNFSWRVAGNWNDQQLQILQESGQILQDFITGLKGQPAPGWVKRHFRSKFHTEGGWIQRVVKPLQGKSFVFPWFDVWMNAGFENSHRPQQHVIHELGHVFDNHLGGWLPATLRGGGPADRMVRATGGAPEKGGVRFYPKRNYAAVVTPVESWEEGAYGNVNVAEDFAETFTNTIFQPEIVPPARLAWMRSFLKLLP